MKYSFRFLGLIAAASIVFFSCEKETALDVADEVPETTDPATEEKTTPEENTEFDPSEYLLSFGASFENDAQTKVDIAIGASKATFTFKSGDEARACNDEASAVYVYDGEKFAIKAGETPIAFGVGVQVFYPADEFSADAGTVTFTMPAAIEDVDDLGAKNPLAGKIAGSSGNWSVTFKAVGSILQVGVTGDGTLNSLTLSNTAFDLGEGAEFTIGWDGDGNPTMATTGDTKKSMAITGLTQALSSSAATYYFLLPAGIAYTDLTITAGLDAPHNGGSDTFSIVRGDGNVARNKVMTMSFYAGLFSGGAGTMGDPYKIACARDFRNISKYCAEGYTPGSKDAASFLGAIYKQTANISFGKDAEHKADLSAYMIASSSTPFTGTYDGDNKTLSNFTITGSPSDTYEGVAPFKAINGAVLKNIAISGAEINGGKFTAGLVGYAAGAGATIQNCSIVNSSLSSNVDYGVGGLIGGLYNGTVTSCTAADLTITDSSASKNYYGGLISYINGTLTVSECSVEAGSLTFTGAQNCGGIAGETNNANTTIQDCINKATITSNKNYLGGIVGYQRAGTLSSCGNTGNITGVAGVGGLVGQMGENGTNTPEAYGIITNKCYNTGAIEGTGNNVGGLVGVATAGRIEQSRNTGNISSTGSNVGGIVAQLKVGDVNACYSGYNNTVTGASDVGGIVGLLYPITYKSSANRWLGGTKVINCQSSSYIESTGTDNEGAAGCIVGWARQVSGNWGIVIANCTNWGAAGRVKNTASGTDNSNLGGIVGRLNGGNWAIVDNCFSYVTNNALQKNGDYINNSGTTAASTAPFVNFGPIYGYMTGNYATIRDCFYRSGWNNANYLGKDGRSTKTENIVMIKLANDNVGKGTQEASFNLYSAAKTTYTYPTEGTTTFLAALNRSAHNISDESTFKNYQTNVNTSNIYYEGWAQPTSGGWLVPAALVALGPEFYKN